MFGYLPPPPDAVTLEAMIAWATGGAALGFGSVLFKWLSKRGWRRAPAEALPHIPGAPNDHDAGPAP